MTNKIALNLCDAPPDTPPFTSHSVRTQIEVEATLSIGFSGKGFIVSLVWLDILDRRSTSRKVEDGAFNVLPSVSWKEKIFIVLQ